MRSAISFVGKCFGQALLLVLIVTSTGRAASDADAIKRLEQMVQQQQAQIESQAKAIDALRRQIDQFTGRTGISAEKPAVSAPAEGAAAETSEEKERQEVIDAATETVSPAVEPLNEMTGVRTGNDKVSVQLYGQVDKAVLYTDDGNDDYWYIVDNSNSTTRLGLYGRATTDALEVGSRIEVQFATNPSASVSQTNQHNVGANNFQKRHFDLWVAGKRFGEVRLGYGDTASNASAEIDLSGTALIGYSSVSDMAGGQFFFDPQTATLSGTKVGDVFNNMDGLSRDDRILYRTPEFYGFKAATSFISGGSNDIAVAYASKLGPVKLAAAAAYAYYGANSATINNQYSGSASALHDSGFNLTFATGKRDFIAFGRDNATYYYGKFGYRRDFFDFGTTSLAIDLGRFNDVDANNDESDTYGFLGLQSFTDWGTEYFIGFRKYKLDRPGTELKDVNAAMTGLRLKF